jgi:hypothetical protein
MAGFPVTRVFPIEEFSEPDMLAFQKLLLKARFPPGPLDGLYGPRDVGSLGIIQGVR